MRFLDWYDRAVWRPIVANPWTTAGVVASIYLVLIVMTMFAAAGSHS